MLFFNVDNFTCTSREIFSVGVHSLAVEGNCNNSLVVNLEVGMFDVYVPFVLFQRGMLLCLNLHNSFNLRDRDFLFFRFAGMT